MSPMKWLRDKSMIWTSGNDHSHEGKAPLKVLFAMLSIRSNGNAALAEPEGNSPWRRLLLKSKVWRLLR